MLNISENNFIDKPLFMENDGNYYFDKEKGKYVLNNNVSEQIKKSYEEFYKDLESD